VRRAQSRRQIMLQGLRFESTLHATTSNETLMRTAETGVRRLSGAIGAVYADPRATALEQVEQRVKLFPVVRQACRPSVNGAASGRLRPD
jgi:hypothetical protein